MELGDLAAKHIATCKQLSDEQFGILSEAVLEAVVGIRALEQSAAAGIGSRESEAGIALLLVEAAKGGISGGDLEALMIEEFQIGQVKAKKLAEVYARNESKLTDSLKVHARASPVARLVDFKWRADHVISSSQDGAGSHQQFHISLKTSPPSAAAFALAAGVGSGGVTNTNAGEEEEEIKFTCNREQMQHLVSKLREACRAAEKYES